MHLATLQQLLTSGDGNGVSALAWACNQRHAHCVQLLLNAGDAEAQVASVDRNGVTPLHLCCFYGSTACARLLLAHVPAAQLSAKSTSHSWLLPPGSTPLMVAGHYGHHEMVKVLLQHGSMSRQVTATDNEGSTALHHACIKGHAPVVAALLECCPLETRLVQLAQMNGDFLPAVNLAASLAHPKCLEVLLSYALPPEAFLDMALFASVQAMVSGGQAEGQVDAPEAGPPVPGGVPVAVAGPAAPPAHPAGQGIVQGDGLAGEGQLGHLVDGQEQGQGLGGGHVEGQEAVAAGQAGAADGQQEGVQGQAAAQAQGPEQAGGEGGAAGPEAGGGNQQQQPHLLAGAQGPAQAPAQAPAQPPAQPPLQPPPQPLAPPLAAPAPQGAGRSERARQCIELLLLKGAMLPSGATFRDQAALRPLVRDIMARALVPTMANEAVVGLAHAAALSRPGRT